MYQGISREKRFMELGLRSLKSRRWFRLLCCMFKITKNQTTEYLNKLISTLKQNFNSRNIYIPSYNCRTEYFKPSLFSASLVPVVPPWSEYKKFRDYQCIQTKTIAFHSYVRKQYFKHFWHKGLKLLTRLRVGFSHLNELRFRHNFQECLNPLCACSLEIEITTHYLLHCHLNTPFVLILRIV